MDFTFLPFITVIFSLIFILFKVAKQAPRLRLPPGPDNTSLSGVSANTLKVHQWKKYAEWAKSFKSPIIFFRTYNRQVVVLNDLKSVRDLLVKRASIYSDRPYSWMYFNICGREKTVFNISSSSKRHTHYRKLLHNGINGRAIRNYWSLLEDEATVLVNRIVESPEKYQQHLRQNTSAVIMKMAYGYQITDNDPLLQLAEDSARISGWALAPGRWLVDYYPILRFLPRWFPKAEFKRIGSEWKRRMDLFSDLPFEWVKKQMASGNYTASFTSRLLENVRSQKQEEDFEDIIKWCAVGLHAGAADTTVSAMTSFILLMALHPEVQRRAQMELDECIGVNQTPHVADLTRLEYLNAIMKEVLRYAPVGNLALPHRVTQEDIYCSYRIPKNATVLANVWAIMHDPTIFPDPFTFDPDRFLKKNPKTIISQSDPDLTALNPDPRMFAFGFGRRTCPGMQFAEVSMLLCMANILAKVDICLPTANLTPEIDYTNGLTSHIKPFDIEIRLR
ncbi:cytochrome P450 [Dendrothele bispora CBS 962.96]|uniref:Cytochrome P450 n=1 Tax=Dendrothele bispora (strain CBS 962.96) TaxID=1314807 RepID=A0A4S8M0N7_DENBC|nr:cytochrome P450 [Dendrothele bispora CBS 962.96]